MQPARDPLHIFSLDLEHFRQAVFNSAEIETDKRGNSGNRTREEGKIGILFWGE